MVLQWYCSGTATALLRYGRGMVPFGSVQFETAIIMRIRSLARVSCMQLMWSLMSVVRNEQTLIPTLASFSAIAVGLYPPLNQ